MTHRRRLELLADALRVAPADVVGVLRRLDVQYYDSTGVLVFDAAAWSDERMVKAAFEVFVSVEAGDLPTRFATSSPASSRPHR